MQWIKYGQKLLLVSKQNLHGYQFDFEAINEISLKFLHFCCELSPLNCEIRLNVYVYVREAAKKKFTH